MLTEQELLEHGIDSTRKVNLLKLAAYLRGLDREKFNMRSFYKRYDEYSGRLVIVGPSGVGQYSTTPNYCNTVACAVGCGPAAGVPVIDTDTGWSIYSQRVFTSCARTWDFLFSIGWVNIDNSPSGAAKRIEFLLEHGLKNICPSSTDMDDFFDKMDGLPYA